MCTDEEFRLLLTNWDRAAHLTNMGCERLLAQIKCAAMSAGSGAAPDVERICAAGTLTQWLGEHLAARGTDPRFKTRKQLLDWGAPLQCHAKRHKVDYHRAAGSFVTFLNMKRSERLARGEKLEAGAARLEIADLKEQWANMSDDAKHRYINIAVEQYNQAEVRRMQVAAAGDAEPNPTHMYNVGVLWGLGDKNFPLSVANLERAAIAAYGEGFLPGSRKYCDALREKMRSRILVRDRGPCSLTA